MPAIVAVTDSGLKQRLRSEALSRRNALAPVDRAARSLRAAGRAEHFIASVASVSGYWPIRSEIDPRPLLALAQTDGLAVALPVLLDDDTMIFRRWDAGTDLVPAGFGTVGPPAEAPQLRPDMVIVPMAAFDRRGHRIGYGKGHYDRAIARLHAAAHRPILVGLAFAVQEVENVPFEAHDIPLDFIATEDELIAAPVRDARG